MLYGGNATVYVSNMDQAVRFYTEVLSLVLTNRFGNPRQEEEAASAAGAQG